MTPEELKRLHAQMQWRAWSRQQTWHEPFPPGSQIPSLRQVVGLIEADAGEQLAHRYPQGRTYLLDGLPDAPDLHDDGCAGFADRPFTDLSRRNVEAFVHRVQVSVGRRQVARSRVLAITDPRAHGAGAAEQVVRAARAISAALVETGWAMQDPLAQLATPPRNGPTRDTALTRAELLDYARLVLQGSQDPELDALIWVTLRVAALRNAELIALRATGADPDRGAITVFGKGARIREMPLHRPLLDAILRRPRDADPDGPLFQTAAGSPVSGRRFDGWSDRLHAGAGWARGHRISVHILRGTTARDIEGRFGLQSLPPSLYLGHSTQHDLGTIADYLTSPFRNEWTLRRLIAEGTFGPLDQWPGLPEAVALRHVLPQLVDPPPSTTGRPTTP